MACSCGYSTDMPNCNGTHKVVKKVRSDIADKVVEWIATRDLWTDQELIDFIKNGK
jgi:CDGSH-type Zn-finger protein